MLQNPPPSSPDYHPQPILRQSLREWRLIARNLNGQGSQMHLPLQVFDDCTDCVNDPCASLPLSSECTDQCVVITCTDPAHELSPPKDQLRRSDLSCKSDECSQGGCSAFDELVRRLTPFCAANAISHAISYSAATLISLMEDFNQTELTFRNSTLVRRLPAIATTPYPIYRLH